MFRAYCDDVLFYDDESTLDEYKLVDPQLDLVENDISTFTFTIPVTNVLHELSQEERYRMHSPTTGNIAYYTFRAGKGEPVYYYSFKRPGKLIPFVSVIKVYRDDELWFEGCPTTVSRSFDMSRTITCESVLGYLKRSVPLPITHKGVKYSLENKIKMILNAHNNMVERKYEIYCGEIDTSVDKENVEPSDENFELTADSCFDNLQAVFKNYVGIYTVRLAEDGKHYLDYSDKERPKCTQQVNFQENLLDYTEDWSFEDICTCVVPLGKKIEGNPNLPGSNDRYLNLQDYYKEIESSSRDYFLKSSLASDYGVIAKIVKNEDITRPLDLWTMARKYLEDTQFADMTIEISAFDLSYLNEVEPPALGGYS